MWKRSRFGRLLPAAVAGGLTGLIGLASGGCAARQAVTASSPPVSSVPKSSALPTIETADARLAGAVADLAAEETVATLNAAAAEYVRVGVLDRANALLNRAIQLAPADAGSFAARARVWRAWGLPEVGLADAHRAVFLAPDSADAHNTLGTLLVAVGALDAAAASFKHALSLEPGAAWAQNNLCYVALMRGDEGTALARCAAALERASDLATARNNLALVHASAGRLDDARAAFLSTGDRPAGLYNMGIVLMARREYGAAAEVFGAACRELPSFAGACGREAEARAIAAGRPAGKKQP